MYRRLLYPTDKPRGKPWLFARACRNYFIYTVEWPTESANGAFTSGGKLIRRLHKFRCNRKTPTIWSRRPAARLARAVVIAGVRDLACLVSIVACGWKRATRVRARSSKLFSQAVCMRGADRKPNATSSPDGEQKPWLYETQLAKLFDVPSAFVDLDQI
jgi:hypothetical protein